MMIGLLGIVLAYGLAVAAVHAAYILHRTHAGEPDVIVVCVTHNHEQVIEWYLRVFRFRALLTGRSIEIKVYDEASSDETMSIVRKTVQSHYDVSILASSEQVQQELVKADGIKRVLVELSKQSDHRRVPAFI